MVRSLTCRRAGAVLSSETQRCWRCGSCSSQRCRLHRWQIPRPPRTESTSHRSAWVNRASPPRSSSGSAARTARDQHRSSPQAQRQNHQVRGHTRGQRSFITHTYPPPSPNQLPLTFSGFSREAATQELNLRRKSSGKQLLARFVWSSTKGIETAD